MNSTHFRTLFEHHFWFSSTLFPFCTLFVCAVQVCALRRSGFVDVQVFSAPCILDRICSWMVLLSDAVCDCSLKSSHSCNFSLTLFLPCDDSVKALICLCISVDKFSSEARGMLISCVMLSGECFHPFRWIIYSSCESHHLLKLYEMVSVQCIYLVRKRMSSSHEKSKLEYVCLFL